MPDLLPPEDDDVDVPTWDNPAPADTDNGTRPVAPAVESPRDRAPAQASPASYDDDLDDDGPPIPPYDDDRIAAEAAATKAPPAPRPDPKPAQRREPDPMPNPPRPEPPHSDEVEQSLIGSLLYAAREGDRKGESLQWAPGRFAAVDRIVSPRDFYRPQHQIIMEAIVSLAHAGKPFDAVAVSTRLEETNRLDKAGGIAYLAELSESVGGSSAIVFYAESIAERAQRRRISKAAGRLAEKAFGDTKLADLANAATSLAALAIPKHGGASAAASLYNYAEVDMHVWAWLWENWLPKGELTLLAGAPESGKGLLATAIIAGLSRGDLPDGLTLTRPLNVLIIQSEDDDERTVTPRLHRHGADRTNVFGLRRERGKTPLRQLIEGAEGFEHIDLIYVDPLGQGFDGNANHEEDVRPFCEEWVNVARRLDAAVLGVLHTGKYVKRRLMEGDLADLIKGSQAWLAVARFALGLFVEPTSQDRLFVRVKSNADSVDKRNGFRVRAVMVEGERVVNWPLQLEPDILQTVREAIADKTTSDVREALMEQIDGMETGEMYPYADIRTAVGEETGKSRQAIDKQAKRLAKEGVIVIHGEGRGRPIQWALPSGRQS